VDRRFLQRSEILLRVEILDVVELELMVFFVQIAVIGVDG